jgi:hypothetical protein
VGRGDLRFVLAIAVRKGDMASDGACVRKEGIRRMRCDRPLAVVLGLLFGAALPVAAPAQSPGEIPGQTYSLSAQQKEDILAHGSESRVDDSLLWARSGGDGKIHGEIGMEVGTRNTRGIYGDAVIPLGKGATVALSFDHYQTDPGKFRWRRNQMYYTPGPGALPDTP